ncbi:MAG: ketose-bisphosphate aldolase [Alphaproteobacteria bacterium]|nr:ketose-bisphosphate aldolase [Alphaproteobacteria bacterium]
MKYTELGLVNTNKMFQDAVAGNYAIPAFNFYNMETLNAILNAVRETHSPVILAVSESALKYMGDDMLIGMIRGANIQPHEQIALHLDHGSSIDACKKAIKLGFSSVMIDASKMPFDENIKISKNVAELAHKHNVSVEAELGTLGGIEDENTFGIIGYTNPADVEKFVKETNIDSLAVAIGTSHGAYKHKATTEELRFDILSDIATRLPGFPLVLHGASNIPQKLISTINEFGGKISGALGIDEIQLRRATKLNICKINVDSDLRLAFTAGVRKSLAQNPNNFNPRDYLREAQTSVTQTCIDEIKNIMGSDKKITNKWAV